MTVGMQQPYLFPYLGYWQMVNAVDTFVIGDYSHMINDGWIHQNRLLQRHGAPFYFRLNIKNKRGAYMRPICEVEIDDNSRKKWNSDFYNMLYRNYGKARYYEETLQLLTLIIESEESNLSNFLANQIHAIADYLDMNTTIVRGKDVLEQAEYNLPVMEKFPIIRDRLGFDTWLSLSNGAHYYTKEMMAEIGIDIRFHQFDSTVTYPQIGVRKDEPHIPYLSIIDVLMNCGKEGTKALLNKYTVV